MGEEGGEGRRGREGVASDDGSDEITRVD